MSEATRMREENTRKLLQCPQHAFGRFQGLNLPLTCQHCGGTMDVEEAMLYREGFAAAGGNPNEVLLVDEGGES